MPQIQENGLKHFYHIKRTVIDWHHDKSGAAQYTSIRGTFTKLSAAKIAARNCIFDEGYERSWFTSFLTNTSEKPDEICEKPWEYGENVMVHAFAESGEEFFVSIDTIDNPVALSVQPVASSEIVCRLFHVLKTTTSHAVVGSPELRSVRILGTYLTRKQAEHAARVALRWKHGLRRDDFEEYDEQDDASWCFGDDVRVHAVTSAGEDIFVSVSEKPARNPLDVENLVKRLP